MLRKGEFGKLARSYSFFLLCTGTEKQAFQTLVLGSSLKSAKVLRPCSKLAHNDHVYLLDPAIILECCDQIQSLSVSSRHF